MARFYPTQVTRLTTSAALLLAALLTPPTYAQQGYLLPSYNAIYATSIKGFTIDGYRSLRRDDNGIYRLHMKAKALLMTLSEESYFAVSDNGTLIPHSYQYTFNKPIGRAREQSITFNWANLTAEGKTKKSWQVPLTQGMSDRLNVLTALRVHMMTHGTDSYEANIVDKGEVKSYTLSFKGRESITTPMGQIDTVLMARDDADRKSYFWLAPTWNYQLIRFVQEESDGDRYELNLKHLEFAPGEEPSALTLASTKA